MKPTKKLLFIIVLAITLSQIMGMARAEDTKAPAHILTIGGMDSEDYYIDYAAVTIEDSNGIEIFNGYLVNGSVNTYYYVPSILPSQEIHFLPFNISLEEGSYLITAIRDSEYIDSNYRKGSLVYENTYSLSEDANISLFLEFQPKDSSTSDLTIDAVVWIHDHTNGFIGVIGIIFLICLGINYLLRTKYGREGISAIVYFIPLAIMAWAWLVTASLEDSYSLTIGLRGTKDQLLFGLSILCIGYGISSYIISRRYRDELDPHPIGKIYMVSAIFFTLGGALLAFLVISTSMVTCYMPIEDDGPPRKMSGIAIGLLISQREQMLQDFHQRGIIEGKTYEKLKNK